MTKEELIKILTTDVEKWNSLNLVDANLQDANLQDANLQDADLQDANLQDANLQDANLRGASLYRANLRGASLYRASLYRANLYRANLYRANLYRANLRGASLYRASLYHANLRGANLYRANLQGADLQGASLPAPTVVLLANWQTVSDELTLELMRYDAACHPDPKAFDTWVETNNCPYDSVKTQRAANFKEKKELWSPGESKRPWDLMVRCIQEVCANSDFHEQKGGE